MDLTVTAIPFYFGTMGVEHKFLLQRARKVGPTPADYTRADTLASLSMGVGSLVIPLATQAVARKFTPGKGRFPHLLVRTAVGSVVATTIADQVAKRTRSDKVRRMARRVARVAAPTAVAAGAIAVGTTVTDRTNATRMWERGRRHDLGEGWAGWLAAIAGWDFIYYWNHRFMHEVRALWAIHVVHHSSERYNLSTALRQPVADTFGVFLPYGLLSAFGVRPRLVLQARAINLIYQYWIHTDAIRRLGPAEEVLNTPSHHRVHHGSNRQYIDRNHGSILIVWDRLFGTFEKEDEPVVYGLTKNIDTFRPDRIADHEYLDMIRDVADSDNWADRLSFVFRGPGWAYARHRQQAATQLSAV